jgi:hypothetical protein
LASFSDVLASVTPRGSDSKFGPQGVSLVRDLEIGALLLGALASRQSLFMRLLRGLGRFPQSTEGLLILLETLFEGVHLGRQPHRPLGLGAQFCQRALASVTSLERPQCTYRLGAERLGPGESRPALVEQGGDLHLLRSQLVQHFRSRHPLRYIVESRHVLGGALMTRMRVPESVLELLLGGQSGL